MILVDTNVIIAFWRSPTEKLKLLFEENHIVISGVTRSELLHGAKDATRKNTFSVVLYKESKSLFKML